jgi:hypothetical protein
MPAVVPRAERQAGMYKSIQIGNSFDARGGTRSQSAGDKCACAGAFACVRDSIVTNHILYTKAVQPVFLHDEESSGTYEQRFSCDARERGMRAGKKSVQSEAHVGMPDAGVGDGGERTCVLRQN